MYRKTLIALACAVISAPAFAQSSLPECSHQLSRYQEQCSYLTPPPQPSPPPPPPARTTADDFGYVRSNPSPPPSMDLRLPDGLFVGRGMNGGGVGGPQWHF
jgi:hypothetical protein